MNGEEDEGKELLNSLTEPITLIESADAIERRRKHQARVIWKPECGRAEVVRLTGNFWKTHGFSKAGINYLHAEEVIYLHQKDRLYVEHLGSILGDQALFSVVMKSIPLACYLAYVKLKGLEYIITRHTKHLRCWSSEVDLYDCLRLNPSQGLLETMVSYNIYAHDGSLVKRKISETTPTSYVVVTEGKDVFSPRVLLTLLAEAKGVPIVFAVFLPSGNVVLEELSDATRSLKWKNTSQSPQQPAQTAASSELA